MTKDLQKLKLRLFDLQTKIPNHIYQTNLDMILCAMEVKDQEILKGFKSSMSTELGLLEEKYKILGMYNVY